MNKLINLITASILIGCGQFEKQKGTCLAIAVDVTDSFPEIQRELTAEGLKPYFNLSENPAASANCIIATLSAFRYNTYRISRIDGQSTAETNSISRKKEMEKFYSGLEANLREVKEQKSGKPLSYVSHGIAQLLTKLAECGECKTRKAIIISDLAENTPKYSVYDKRGFALLKDSPDSLAKLLDTQYPLSDLTGIEITLVHEIKNQLDDELFYATSQFFKRYYESHGAIVTISSSLTETGHGQ